MGGCPLQFALEGSGGNPTAIAEMQASAAIGVWIGMAQEDQGIPAGGIEQLLAQGNKVRAGSPQNLQIKATAFTQLFQPL